MTDSKAIRRDAARVILVDARDRIFLHHIVVPGRGIPVWITPGGGVNEGESYHDAAVRELWEETSIRVTDLGAPVWKRRHVFDMNDVCYEAIERYFLLRVDREDPQPAAFEELEASCYIGAAWWTVPAIEDSTETFAPRTLATCLSELLHNGAPATPVDVGV